MGFILVDLFERTTITGNARYNLSESIISNTALTMVGIEKA